MVTVRSAAGTTVTVEPFDPGLTGFPVGTPVEALSAGARTTLAGPIPTGSLSRAQILVRDSAFAAAISPGETLRIRRAIPRFLDTFESVFEELEAAIEGTPGTALRLTFQSSSGAILTVASFNTAEVGFPAGAVITIENKTLRTVLTAPIPAHGSGLSSIQVVDNKVGAALQAGDIVIVHQGGLPDLFGVDTTPPPQLQHRPQPDFDYLSYLASWIGLPLRPEKPVDWNRRFFNAAIPVYPQRSTVSGIDALIRAWLKDDLMETVPPLLILTDLTRAYNDVDAIFQIAPEKAQDARPGEVYAQLGLNTSLGEGAPFFFIADLITDPAVRDLRNPAGVDVFERAARYLLDVEKPAYTQYQLRVRGQPMQLAPASAADARPAETYAQFEDMNPDNPLTGTTLLWDGPDVFESDQ
jgi:hypothetical protein